MAEITVHSRFKFATLYKAQLWFSFNFFGIKSET